MQSFLLLAALGFEAFGPASFTQDVTRKVTFVSPATRVELLLPELSKAAGVSLLFSPQVKDEVLIVSVRDVPMSVLLEKVATAASAEWQREGEAYRLIRSAKLLQKLKDEHVERLALEIAKGQERMRKSLETAGDYDEAMARSVSERLVAYLADLVQNGENNNNDRRRMEAMRPVLPGYRLASRISLALDPKTIASIPIGERVVFSTQPNRLQKPFPKGVQAAFQSYAREAKLLAAQVPENPKMPSFGVESNIWRALNLRSVQDFVPHKALMIVSPPEYGNMSAQMQVANEKGRIIESAYLNLLTVPPTSNPPPPPATADLDEKVIELSPLSKAYMQYVQRAYAPNPDKTARMSAELTQFFLNPELHETTSLVFSDVVLATAKAKGLNMIVSPSYGAMGPGAGKDVAPTRFLSQLRSSPYGGLTILEEQGWVVAKPSAWYRARNNAPDRQGLGKFLRNAIKRAVNLEDVAALATAMPSSSAYQTAFGLLSMVSPKAVDRMSQNDYDLMRFHGSLTPPQREAAQGDGLPVSGLTPWQKTQLDRMVFFNEYSLRANWEYRGGAEEPEGPHSNIYFQPTERYALGFPPDAKLVIHDRSRRSIRCIGRTSENSITMTYADEPRLAQMLFSKERPESNVSGQERDFNEFTVVDQTHFQYLFKTEPRLSYDGQITFTNGQSETVDSIDKLPPEVLEKVNSELAKLREQFKNRKPPPR